ncbi:MAG: prenyltransferase [Clostridium sp.]|uniref:prenyltransferase n=1 Tax=Clostridium sp. TaxID=1506 RepID=UPI003EE517B2
MRFLKRVYTVIEMRTGFATGLPVLSAGLFGAYLKGELNIGLLILMFISGFSFNIVANVANEIRGYLKKEDIKEVLTGHKGSEGLARGDASLIDAIVGLLIFFIIGSISGLGIVFITKEVAILFIGAISALAAICYSLGPKPYIVYPVGELVSGIFVGGISSLVSAYIQFGEVNIEVVLYSIIGVFMTIFLMSTNNTSDYNKDKGHRVTLPHMIGFEKSIKIILPEGILMIMAFISLYLIKSIELHILIIGLLVIYYFGYEKWYKGYSKIKKPFKEMGRLWGPKPLLLIYSFNISMSILFLSNILMEGKVI